MDGDETHDRVHQPSRFGRLLREVLLTPVRSARFRAEHAFSCHRYFATTRYGVRLYTFFFHSIPVYIG